MKNLYTNFLSITCFLLITNSIYAQKLKSPSDFLGYPLGSKFSYHHRVLDYLEYVEEQSKNVKLKEYGKTYEDRPLMVAFVSSKENLNRLDEIRENNLKRTGIIEGQFHDSDIVVVWLSYNVHGNEANSTETSMKVLYELVNGENSKYDKWLEKLVIIIDPCLNPDGRDRYVNWYNQVANSIPNPELVSREHHEGWNHGRSNHYMFDLNRDWVWQTQRESIYRVKLYNKWMPQVHVDFHEQFFNSQYYFAPAAEPMHELITNWQRDFQKSIGTNNAKYFDEKGWLYFTRESFDLLYPGYGDTYPMYNGAIGMTYEMPGHSAAGLAVKTNKGDTLTLMDRIEMHFTTSIATLESCYENRQNLVDEFSNYFNKKSGNKNSYLLKSPFPDRIDLLTKLLTKNNIIYKSPSGSKSIRGFSYNQGEDVDVEATKGDLIVPINQPKSTLVKVLFERNTKLVDSLTYDITAWSLPFVYGLEAYEIHSNLNLQAYEPKRYDITKSDPHPYAYILNWTSMKDAQFLSELLKEDIRVNYSTKKFQYANDKFNPGTLIITRIDNPVKDFDQKITQLATKLSRNLIPVFSGMAITSLDLGSQKVKFLKKPKIAMLAGEEISTLKFGELWYFFEQELRMPIDIIKKSMVKKIDLNNYDVIVLASGKYKELQGEEGFKKLDEWIKRGGRLVLVENAIVGFIGEDKFELEKLDDEEDEKEEEKTVLYPYKDSERENLKKYIQGGIIKLEIDNTHPLAYGYEKIYFSLNNNHQVYKFFKDGWNVGYIKSEDKAIAGFIGSESKEKLENNLVMGVEERGKGKVIYFVDDPVFRAFWQNGKLFMANAVFF